MTITNVPGPPVPLYVAGARIHSAFGMAPILDGLGLILVVLSYHGRLSIGISSCQQIVPDPDNMAKCIERSLVGLEQAVSRAEPAMLTVEQSSGEAEPQDPLKSFHDAGKALDEAIESLED